MSSDAVEVARLKRKALFGLNKDKTSLPPENLFSPYGWFFSSNSFTGKNESRGRPISRKSSSALSERSTSAKTPTTVTPCSRKASTAERVLLPVVRVSSITRQREDGSSPPSMRFPVPWCLASFRTENPSKGWPSR